MTNTKPDLITLDLAEFSELERLRLFSAIDEVRSQSLQRQMNPEAPDLMTWFNRVREEAKADDASDYWLLDLLADLSSALFDGQLETGGESGTTIRFENQTVALAKLLPLIEVVLHDVGPRVLPPGFAPENRIVPQAPGLPR